MTVRAECAWVNGPDVLVIVKDKRFINLSPVVPGRFLYGHSEYGTFDLTCEEAEALIKQLTKAIAQAKNYEERYLRHKDDKREEKTDKEDPT